MTTVLIFIAALLLDRWLGEPARFHPLAGFGRLVNLTENRMRNPNTAPGFQILAGGIAWALLVIPPVLLAYLIASLLPRITSLIFDMLILYLSIALNSLHAHARAVELPLLTNDLARARDQVGRIVSRDTGALDNRGVTNATIESVLENGCDAVIAPLFWYAIAGAPGVVLHRLANTLDACWGYRNARYYLFGRVSARMDDLLNWLPARLCALLYCLCGSWQNARRCRVTQGRQTASPNAGVVMAAGAGALGIQLGGPARYHGREEWRPPLGCGRPATVDPGHSDIGRALALLNHSTWLLIAGFFALALILGVGR